MLKRSPLAVQTRWSILAQRTSSGDPVHGGGTGASKQRRAPSSLTDADEGKENHGRSPTRECGGDERHRKGFIAVENLADRVWVHRRNQTSSSGWRTPPSQYEVLKWRVDDDVSQAVREFEDAYDHSPGVLARRHGYQAGVSACSSTGVAPGHRLGQGQRR
ncbi:MAG: hypothetical protein ACLSAF_19550 [Intestinimonas sp.]